MTPFRRASRWSCALALMLLMVACEEPKPAPKAAAPKEAPLPEKASAVFDTTAGKMTCELFPKQTPQAVANFIGLAEGTREWKHPLNGRTVHFHLYDGTPFHRVLPGFMIQGGDPKGDGTGDPGYKLNDEIVPGLRFDKPGRLAYANEGPNTNGAQFFITEVPTPHLNGKFTIFGQCDTATVALVKKDRSHAARQSQRSPVQSCKD